MQKGLEASDKTKGDSDLLKTKKQNMKKARDVITKEKDILSTLNLTADMEQEERRRKKNKNNPPEPKVSTPRRRTRPRFL